MFGDYATVAAHDLLNAHKYQPHPTSVADLHSVRLATATETDNGSILAEAKVKQLAGGDRLTARRMREDFCTFDPTHKLIVAANHRPKVRGDDHALWRHLLVVPFDITIPADKIDRTIADRITTTELLGVLNWAVACCIAWHQQGLNPPDEVRAASDDYRREQDLIGRWLTNNGLNITSEPAHTIPTSDLKLAFDTWANDTRIDTTTLG